MLKKNVLRYQKEYDRVYKEGKSAHDRYVVVFALKNGMNCNRISFLASGKVGNSVQRNRARRLMRESFRTMDKISSGYDIIIIARNKINGKKYADVKKSLEAAFRKLKIYSPENKNR